MKEHLIIRRKKKRKQHSRCCKNAFGVTQATNEVCGEPEDAHPIWKHLGSMFSVKKKKKKLVWPNKPYLCVDYNRKTSCFWHLLGRTDLDCRSVTSRQPSFETEVSPCLTSKPPQVQEILLLLGLPLFSFFPLPNLLAPRWGFSCAFSWNLGWVADSKEAGSTWTSLLGLELHCTSKLYGEIQGNSASHFIHVSISIKGRIFKIIAASSSRSSGTFKLKKNGGF